MSASQSNQQEKPSKWASYSYHIVQSIVSSALDLTSVSRYTAWAGKFGNKFLDATTRTFERAGYVQSMDSLVGDLFGIEAGPTPEAILSQMYNKLYSMDQKLAALETLGDVVYLQRQSLKAMQNLGESSEKNFEQIQGQFERQINHLDKLHTGVLDLKHMMSKGDYKLDEINLKVSFIQDDLRAHRQEFQEFALKHEVRDQFNLMKDEVLGAYQTRFGQLFADESLQSALREYKTVAYHSSTSYDAYLKVDEKLKSEFNRVQKKAKVYEDLGQLTDGAMVLGAFLNLAGQSELGQTISKIAVAGQKILSAATNFAVGNYIGCAMDIINALGIFGSQNTGPSQIEMIYDMLKSFTEYVVDIVNTRFDRLEYMIQGFSRRVDRHFHTLTMRLDYHTRDIQLQIQAVAEALLKHQARHFDGIEFNQEILKTDLFNQAAKLDQLINLAHSQMVSGLKDKLDTIELKRLQIQPEGNQQLLSSRVENQWELMTEINQFLTNRVYTSDVAGSGFTKSSDSKLGQAEYEFLVKPSNINFVINNWVQYHFHAQAGPSWFESLASKFGFGSGRKNVPPSLPNIIFFSAGIYEFLAMMQHAQYVPERRSYPLIEDYQNRLEVVGRWLFSLRRDKAFYHLLFDQYEKATKEVIQYISKKRFDVALDNDEAKAGVNQLSLTFDQLQIFHTMAQNGYKNSGWFAAKPKYFVDVSFADKWQKVLDPDLPLIEAYPQKLIEHANHAISNLTNLIDGKLQLFYDGYVPISTANLVFQISNGGSRCETSLFDLLKCEPMPASITPFPDQLKALSDQLLSLKHKFQLKFTPSKVQTLTDSLVTVIKQKQMSQFLIEFQAYQAFFVDIGQILSELHKLTQAVQTYHAKINVWASNAKTVLNKVLSIQNRKGEGACRQEGRYGKFGRRSVCEDGYMQIPYQVKPFENQVHQFVQDLSARNMLLTNAMASLEEILSLPVKPSSAIAQVQIFIEHLPLILNAFLSQKDDSEFDKVFQKLLSVGYVNQQHAGLIADYQRTPYEVGKRDYHSDFHRLLQQWDLAYVILGRFVNLAFAEDFDQEAYLSRIGELWTSEHLVGHVMQSLEQSCNQKADEYDEAICREDYVLSAAQTQLRAFSTVKDFFLAHIGFLSQQAQEEHVDFIPEMKALNLTLEQEKNRHTEKSVQMHRLNAFLSASEAIVSGEGGCTDDLRNRFEDYRALSSRLSIRKEYFENHRTRNRWLFTLAEGTVSHCEGAHFFIREAQYLAQNHFLSYHHDGVFDSQAYRYHHFTHPSAAGKVIQYAKAKGANFDLSALDENHFSVLNVAAYHANLDFLKYVQSSANFFILSSIQKENEFRDLPLMSALLARSEGHPDIFDTIDFLKDQMCRGKLGDTGDCPVDTQYFKNDQLISDAVASRKTVLHLSALYHDYGFIRCYLGSRFEFDMTLKDSQGLTPLDEALNRLVDPQNQQKQCAGERSVKFLIDAMSDKDVLAELVERAKLGDQHTGVVASVREIGQYIAIAPAYFDEHPDRLLFALARGDAFLSEVVELADLNLLLLNRLRDQAWALSDFITYDSLSTWKRCQQDGYHFEPLSYNADGDTPVHIAARHFDAGNGHHLSFAIEAIHRNRQLRVDSQNNEGDTVLHVVLNRIQHQVKEQEYRSAILAFVLHLYVKQASSVLKNFRGYPPALSVLRDLTSLLSSGESWREIRQAGGLLAQAIDAGDTHLVCTIIFVQDQLVNSKREGSAKFLDGGVIESSVSPLRRMIEDVNLLETCLDCDSPMLKAQDDKGNTPLHWAVNENRLYAVKWLMSCQADLSAKSKEGKTPLVLAIQKDNGRNYEAMINYLLPLLSPEDIENQSYTITSGQTLSLYCLVRWQKPSYQELIERVIRPSERDVSECEDFLHTRIEDDFNLRNRQRGQNAIGYTRPFKDEAEDAELDAQGDMFLRPGQRRLLSWQETSGAARPEPFLAIAWVYFMSKMPEQIFNAQKELPSWAKQPDEETGSTQPEPLKRQFKMTYANRDQNIMLLSVCLYLGVALFTWIRGLCDIDSSPRVRRRYTSAVSKHTETATLWRKESVNYAELVGQSSAMSMPYEVTPLDHP